MTRAETKLLLHSCLIGTLLTLLVVTLDWERLLAYVERPLYDQRARWFQFFSHPPTDRLVHVDIDEGSIDAIGEYPFPRSVIAGIIDELRHAGAKALATDIIYAERQPLRMGLRSDGSPQQIEDDAILAAAMERLGHVVIPLSFADPPVVTRVRKEALEAFNEDLELNPIDLAKRLIDEGLATGVDQKKVEDACLWARRQAMYERVNRELDRDPKLSFEQLRDILLPRTPRLTVSSPVLRVLQRQVERVRSLRHLRPFTIPMLETNLAVLSMEPGTPPLLDFARVAGSTGFVDSLADNDGVYRRIPLFIEHHGRLYPQLGLSLACLMLGVDHGSIVIEPNRLLIPVPNEQPRVIWLHRYDSKTLKRRVGMLMYLPWFGKVRQWETMYDVPNHAQPKQHLPLIRIWDVHQWEQRIIANSLNADDAIKGVLHLVDPARLQRLEREPIPPRVVTDRLKLIDAVLQDDAITSWSASIQGMIDDGEFEDFLAELPDDAERQKYRVFIASVEALPMLADQIRKLDEDIRQRRGELRAILSGRAIILGWTATAAIRDFVPTSLHPQCPGPVVHGVIFNGIMTQETWRQVPSWVGHLITLGIGLLITAASATLTPIRAIVLTFVLVGIYLLVNAVVLFDYGNTIVGLAGPLVAGAVVWPGCTLYRFIVERQERERITHRFRSYVDPALVNYVIEHPDRARLDGEVRELTVVFTDLAGFTNLSEELREQTVPVLNEYMGLMVPIIRRRNGYVNKFLGDGIMFFFGAPWENRAHAADAIATALNMQEVLVDFNYRLTQRGLPNVAMRVGISTGEMVVGDAGSADASDYTVLGDAVNLGARLETANKATGTHVLASDRTVELLVDSSFLFRTVGRLLVVGKSEGVVVYEALSFADRATDEHRCLAEWTNTMVENFMTGRFTDCVEACDRIEQHFGAGKLTKIYRKLCEEYARQGAPDAFDGTIVLEEK